MARFFPAMPLPEFARVGLVSDFLIWGKLPSQADYIRHNVRHDQAAGVQEWIRCQTAAIQPEPAAAVASGQTAAQTKAQTTAAMHRLPAGVRRLVALKSRHHAQTAFWHSLTPAGFTTPVPGAESRSASTSALTSISSIARQAAALLAPAAHAVLPWCFVLPPGSVPFAPKSHVLGVWMDSSDKIGREYPLVMMQTASARWIRQYFRGHAVVPRDWLFYAARCLAHAVYAGQTEQDRPSATRVDHAARLVMQLTSLWGHYRPGWQALLGRGLVAVDAQQLGEIAGLLHGEDVIDTFDGVRYLPWPDWPQRLTGDTPQRTALPAFWQQDLRGRFVSAGQTLAASDIA